MDEHTVGMIRDSLARLEDTCNGIRRDMSDHVAKDEVYWAKIDQQDGAIGVWKWIAGLGGGSGLLAGISQLMNKH